MYKKYLFFTLFLTASLNAAVLRIEDLSGVSVQNYQTGIDKHGNSTVAYVFTQQVSNRDFVSTTSDGSRNIFLQAVTLFSDGSEANRSNAFEFDPSFAGINIDNRTYQLAVSLSGNAVLVWTARAELSININGNVISDGQGRSAIYAAYMRYVGGVFQPWVLTQLSSSLFNVTDFNAAIDESGNAVVAWRVTNGLIPARNVVQAAYKPFNGNWQIPSDPNTVEGTLSSRFFNVSATPAVGIAKGNATVAWQIYNGGTFGLLSATDIFPSATNVVQVSYKTPATNFTLYQTDLSASGFPTAQDSIISTIGFRVSSPPIVTAHKNTSVVTWQIVGNPNTILPDNVVQAFVRQFP